MELISILVVDDTPEELAEILEELRQRLHQRDIIVECDVVRDAPSAIGRLRASSQFDLVFLDIIGVAWEEFLQGCRSAKPYLPVVMLSRQALATATCECLNLGARGFLFKLDLAVGPTYVRQDAAKGRKEWEVVLRQVVGLTQEYRPIKRLLEMPPQVGVITKQGGPKSVISDQIEFLKYVREIPAIRTHFPNLSRPPWTEGPDSFYEMPFYNLKSLRRVILEEVDKDMCLASATDDLRKVLAFAFDVMYQQDVRRDVFATYGEKTYWGKLAQRITDAETAAAGSGKEAVPALARGYRDLLRADRIVIGGKPHRNPLAILQELKEDPRFVAVVQPPRLCMIHGDLHFDNILVDDRLKRREAFKLVDPRGFNEPGYKRGVGDPAYDFGKLLHSAHGYYDLIHKGVYAVNSKKIKSGPGQVEVPALERREWDSVSQCGGGSGDKLTTHKRHVQPWVWDAFEKLSAFLVDWVLDKKVLADDPSFLLRAYLNEALHFCTMGKFHLSIGDEDSVERAISLHVRGIQLMNELLGRWENFKAGEIQAPLGSFRSGAQSH